MDGSGNQNVRKVIQIFGEAGESFLRLAIMTRDLNPRGESNYGPQSSSSQTEGAQVPMSHKQHPEGMMPTVQATGNTYITDDSEVVIINDSDSD